MASPSPDEPTHWMTVAGQQVGPEPFSIVTQRVEAGQIPPSTLVWWSGAPGWLTHEDAVGAGGVTEPADQAPAGLAFQPDGGSGASSADDQWQAPRTVEASSEPTLTHSVFEPGPVADRSAVFQPDPRAAAAEPQPTWAADLPPGPADVVAATDHGAQEAADSGVSTSIPTEPDPQPAPTVAAADPVSWEQPPSAQPEPVPAQAWADTQTTGVTGGEIDGWQQAAEPEPTTIPVVDPRGAEPPTDAAPSVDGAEDLDALIARSAQLASSAPGLARRHAMLTAALISAAIDNGCVLTDLSTDDDGSRFRAEVPHNATRLGVELGPIDSATATCTLTVSWSERTHAGDVLHALQGEAAAAFADPATPGSFTVDSDPGDSRLIASLSVLVCPTDYSSGDRVDTDLVARHLSAITSSLAALAHARAGI